MLLGIGYAEHELEVNSDKLTNLVDEKLNKNLTNGGTPEAKIDSSLMFSKVKYSDVNVTCGYAYNWVFAKNWFFNASLSVGVAYNRSKSDNEREHLDITNFRFKKYKSAMESAASVLCGTTRIGTRAPAPSSIPTTIRKNSFLPTIRLAHSIFMWV